MAVAAKEYVNGPRGVYIDDDGQISVSKIYAWYLDDFGGSDKTILDHIRGYADDNLHERLSTIQSIEHYHYDWRLNDTRYRNMLVLPSIPKRPVYNK